MPRAPGILKPQSEPDAARRAPVMQAGSRRLCLLCLLVLWLAACQTPSARPPAYTAPHLSQETIAPEFLFQTLVARRAGLIDIKSFVRATVTKNKQSHSFKQALLVMGDDSLRLDTLDVFGRPQGVFIRDQGETLLYDLGKNRVYRGREAWDAMEKIVGAIGDFDEYISLLS
ncbi:MAG: hypothetical protein ACE5G9_10700, partial [Nitrospinales bacterium]